MDKWISILDSLPENGKGCLIVTNKGYITVGYRMVKPNNQGHNWQMFGDNDMVGVDAQKDYITHWMPLPNPPKLPQLINSKLYQYPQ